MDFILPVMIAVLLAYSINGGSNKSIYDVLLVIKNLPYFSPSQTFEVLFFLNN